MIRWDRIHHFLFFKVRRKHDIHEQYQFHISTKNN